MGADAEPHEADVVVGIPVHGQAAQEGNAAPAHDVVIEPGKIVGQDAQGKRLGDNVVEPEARFVDSGQGLINGVEMALLEGKGVLVPGRHLARLPGAGMVDKLMGCRSCHDFLLTVFPKH